MQGGTAGQSSDIWYGYTNNRRNGLSYDASGNLTNDIGQAFTYDATGQQTASNYTNLQNYYDGDGLRVKRTEDSKDPALFLRSTVLGGQIVAEIDYVNSNWQWQRGHIYQGSQLLAVQYSGAVYWMHEDPVTKSKRVTNTGGTTVNTVELDPWGADTPRSSPTDFQPKKFTSYERDGNGSDEAMFRRYNRWQSRLDQPDPYEGSYSLTDPQSFNRYAYTQGDPVNSVDPSGLCTFNINITGLSGQALTDMQNEITRIFNTGGQNVVFGQAGQANGGSMNVAVVSQYTGAFAADISSQGISPRSPAILGVTPPGGASQVNQANIRSGTFSYTTRRASLGTMIGRITSHEVVEHGFLNIREEGIMANDITFGRYGSTQLSSPTNSPTFSISAWTAARLNQLCPPPPPQAAPAATIGRGIGGAGREILPIFRRGGFYGWTSLDFLYIMAGLNRTPTRPPNRRY